MKKQKIESKRRGFNLLDIFIIIVVVALLAGGWYIYSAYTESLQKNKGAIVYQVELKGVEQSFIDAISKGDPLRESIKGNNLGNVKEKHIMAATTTNTDYLNGKFVNVSVPDKLDLILEIASPAEISDKSITVGGLEVKIGQKLFVKGKGYAREGYVLNIDIKE